APAASWTAGCWAWRRAPRSGGCRAAAPPVAVSNSFLAESDRQTGPHPRPRFCFVNRAPRSGAARRSGMVFGSGSAWTFRTACRGARQVYLVGEFNGWSRTAHPMHRYDGDTWELTLTLPPGSHRFRYFTDDGRWLTDY